MKPQGYTISIRAWAVELVSGSKDLADFVHHCADSIERGEWPFGPNSPTIDLNTTEVYGASLMPAQKDRLVCIPQLGNAEKRCDQLWRNFA